MERRAFLKCTTGMLLSTTTYASQIAAEDVWVSETQIPLLHSVTRKLDQIERIVGYARFNLIGFDEAVLVARHHNGIAAFTKEELSYIEEVFYADPSPHGFYGQRTCHHLTEKINEKEVVKISGTGHYLFKGTPHEGLMRIMKDVGPSVVLTSGIRSIVKQLGLHLDKIKSEQGNITQASRSLVPPGYSYHSLGDFDVGKRGWGHENFTASFARTTEFWKLQKLSYIAMRYTPGNQDGVRFEPWHVRIVS